MAENELRVEHKWRSWHRELEARPIVETIPPQVSGLLGSPLDGARPFLLSTNLPEADDPLGDEELVDAPQRTNSSTIYQRRSWKRPPLRLSLIYSTAYTVSQKEGKEDVHPLEEPLASTGLAGNLLDERPELLEAFDSCPRAKLPQGPSPTVA
ncbi:hypothetical protein Cgig2_006838 [Carnegiea gigantea]|uniref:Uncharacterized protein n=1 Tax=Carnegiea gigantea TaxID=171969 RepID=A0A9Q1GG02_9CARY|nr:hypothetical protein Cgig2_006838 [Carnegiea gigantea]